MTMVRLGLLACLLAGAMPGQALAQATPPETMSLEDLMQVTVEPVFGASMRLQPVTDAPSAVTIVTADEIERFGYETVGEILSGVRGLYVTDDHNYSYLGARGFALPGDFNTRILLMVDGHRLNDAVYDQATLQRDLGIDVLAIDRVEIIRGPASSMYGTNAFFAVVNIITKTGAAIDGVRARVGLGSQGTESARVSLGRLFANGVDAAVVAGIGGTDGVERLYFPEYDTPETNNGIAEDLDGERYHQVFGRVAFGDITIRGLVGHREKHVPTAAYESVFGDPRFKTHDHRASISGEYDRMWRGSRVNVQAQVHTSQYEGFYPSHAGDDSVSILRDYADGRWWRLDGRITHVLSPRHTITAGVSLRDQFREVQGFITDDDPSTASEVSNASTVAGIYGQDEITISKHLLVTAGLRYDDHDGFNRFTPRLAVIVKPSADQAFKYLYGTAFRAPNAYEQDYYSLPLRRLDLRPERIASHEVVWERYAGLWLRTSASAYYNSLSDLITFTAGEVEGEYRFENLGDVRARGITLEAEARHQPSGIRGQVSYVLQEARDTSLDLELSNSPRHAVLLKLSGTGPRQLSAAFDVRYMSRRLTLHDTYVDPVVLAHATVRMPVGRHWTISGVVRNLFDRTYQDPGSTEHRQIAIPQEGRTFRVGLEWRLP